MFTLEAGMVGCQFQLGSGGDFVAQFGQELIFGSSVADIKKKIEARWNKSIGRSYSVSFVDSDGNGVVEVYVPKLVKVRSASRSVGNVVGQLELEFSL
jgi:hypothetical protein